MLPEEDQVAPPKAAWLLLRLVSPKANLHLLFLRGLWRVLPALFDLIFLAAHLSRRQSVLFFRPIRPEHLPRLEPASPQQEIFKLRAASISFMRPKPAGALGIVPPLNVGNPIPITAVPPPAIVEPCDGAGAAVPAVDDSGEPWKSADADGAGAATDA